MNKAIAKRRNDIANGTVLKTTMRGLIRKDIPAWISNDGKAFTLNPTVETVHQIFKLYLAGHGCNKIAAILNGQKVPTFGHGKRGWNGQCVYRLIQDRRVIGEYDNNGEKVAGYYPVCFF